MLKKIFTDTKFYIFAITTLIFFGMYCTIQYAPDTYFVFGQPLSESMANFFQSGRIVTGLFFYLLMNMLHFGFIKTYVVSYILAIICTIFSLYKLYKLFKKDIKSDIICVIASILIIINIFSIELFVYIEKGIMMLSVLLCIFAVDALRNFFEGNKKSIFLSIVYMLIANFCYQGTVAIFVAISLIYVIKYSKNIKNFILNNIVVTLVYGIPAIINFVTVRFIYGNSRVSGKIVLSESISKIYAGIKEMILSNYGLFPKYLFFIFLTALIIYGIFKIIKSFEATNQKVLYILGIFYILVGTLAFTIAPQLLQSTNEIWFTARSTYAFTSILGILLIYFSSIIKIDNKEAIIILATSCIFLLIQYIYFAMYTIDNYKVNFEDKEITNQIEELINNYEKETGNVITKISIYNDMNPKYSYDDIKCIKDMNIKAFAHDWSASAIINFYMRRNLVSVPNDDEIKSKFSEQDWNYFNEEQLIFQGDTLHLCNY